MINISQDELAYTVKNKQSPSVGSLTHQSIYIYSTPVYAQCGLTGSLLITVAQRAGILKLYVSLCFPDHNRSETEYGKSLTGF